MLRFRIHEVTLIMPNPTESEHTARAYIAGNGNQDATCTAPANPVDRPVSGASGSSMNASWEARGVVAGE